jgi:hypothetical protein
VAEIIIMPLLRGMGIDIESAYIKQIYDSPSCADTGQYSLPDARLSGTIVKLREKRY